MYLTSHAKNGQMTAAVTSLIKEQFEKAQVYKDVVVSDVMFSKVQGNSYIGSANVSYCYSGYTGQKMSKVINYSMICDGKTVFVTINN